MFSPRYTLRCFDTIPLAGRVEVLVTLLEAMAHANALYLAANPQTPQLYASGVRYLHEAPLGTDNWQDIPYTLAVRSGDCEDLASWRVAELRAAGESAAFHVAVYETPAGCASRRPATPCTIDFHILVVRGSGALEDPSALLGMNR